MHVLDAARLYRLALEKRKAGARYHGFAEAGVPFREIAEAIGRSLKVPALPKSPAAQAIYPSDFCLLPIQGMIGL